MTRTRTTGTGRRTLRRLARIAALPLLALAASAQAQAPGSVQDYQLPPKAAAPAAGPVDNEHPVVVPPTTTTPAPAPAPTIAPPPQATTAPSPTPRPRAASSPGPVPAPQAQAQPSPVAPPAAAASVPSATTPVPVSPPSIEVLPEPVTSSAALPAPEPAVVGSSWPWIAGGTAALLLLGGALLWLRRRSGDEELDTLSPPSEGLPDAAPSPPATLPPRSRGPVPTPPPRPLQAAVTSRPLEMQLEARHLSRAMINATLAYRLTLTNRTQATTGPLRIAGDIVSAHASLSAEEQLAPGDATLATIHEVPALQPGESLSLSGELRLPIASILPIQSGAARVFVPLARFRAEMQDSTTTRIFVIGQASDQPGGALRPFPLDRGPGVDRGLGQRELEMPA